MNETILVRLSYPEHRFFVIGLDANIYRNGNIVLISVVKCRGHVSNNHESMSDKSSFVPNIGEVRHVQALSLKSNFDIQRIIHFFCNYDIVHIKLYV